jgi:CRP/FNR family cyclic AMP-dependent transcriptional regulator
MATETSLLSGVPLFAKLSDAEKADLASLLETREYPPNKPICWLGEAGTEFFIIQQGQCVVVYPDEQGKEVTLAVLGPGQFFGEISLLDGGPRTATVRTVSDTKVLVLERDAFNQFISRNGSAAFHMMTILGQRQRDTLDKLRGIKNANEVIEQHETAWMKLTERIAQISATEGFILANAILIAGWLLYNILRGDEAAFDPWPYELLGLVTGLEGMLLSLFVLIAQNREGDREKIRADLDYQVNLKAHLEVMGLHQKMDRVLGMLGKLNPPKIETPAGEDEAPTN